MKNYVELKFWDRVHRIVVRVYEATRSFPKEELINLTATLRRTATTIGSALVEGAYMQVERESAPAVQTALNAVGQLEYQVLLARDLGYLDETTFDELTTEMHELRRQLQTYLLRLRALR